MSWPTARNSMMNQIYPNVEQRERECARDRCAPWDYRNLEIDEKVILSMDSSKLLKIADWLWALDKVWDVIDAAQKNGVDVSRHVAGLRPRTPDDPWGPQA